MAITWSSCWTADWGGVASAGVELSASTNYSNQSTVTVKVYLRACSTSVGSWSSPVPRVEVTGSQSWTNNNVSFSGGSIGPSEYRLIKTYTHSTSGSTTVTFNVRLLLPDVYEGANGWTNTATQSITTPPAPPPPTPPPGKPTNLQVTRVNDNQQTLTWNLGGGDPSGQRVRRYGGPGAFPYWQNIATVSPSTTTYTDNSTQPNGEYTYAIQAYNSGGSRTSDSASIDTTPAAPGLPSAQRQGDGSIVVTRGALPSHATHWEVWHGQGGTWDATRLALVPASSSTWTYSSPPAAPQHNFRTTAVTDDPVLTSDYSSSTSVNSETPPAAPTNLAPNGTAVDRAAPTKTLTWRHNPLDTTAQRKFQLRWRLDGGSWNTTSEITSGVSEWTTSGMTSPGSVEWQVRTWGNHADPSDWSAVATFPLTTAPAVTITFPEESETVATPSVTVTWTYFQADGSPQQAWEARIVEDVTGAVATSSSGAGAVTSWTSPSVLENVTDYRVEVRAQSSVGVWSDWDSVPFPVAFQPPNAPFAEAVWMDQYGYVLVDIEPQDDGVAPDTVSLTVERSINGGPFVVLAENLDPQSDYLDWTAPLTGDIVYRVTAWSDPPGFARTTASLTMYGQDSCDIWLSGGPSFAIAARLRYVTENSSVSGRQRVLNEYAGRSRPVETSGLLTGKTLSLTVVHLPQRCPSYPKSAREIVDNDNGTVTIRDVTEMEQGTKQASRKMLEQLFDLPGPHLIRTADDFFYGTLSDLEQGNLYLGEARFSITRSDGGTLDQQEAIGRYSGMFLVEVMPGEYQIVGAPPLTETLPGEYQWGGS